MPVGYNRRHPGKRSYDPLLCIEANPSSLSDAAEKARRFVVARRFIEEEEVETARFAMWRSVSEARRSGFL